MSTAEILAIVSIVLMLLCIILMLVGNGKGVGAFYYPTEILTGIGGIIMACCTESLGGR
jgi:flagellar motor component MotA